MKRKNKPSEGPDWVATDGAGGGTAGPGLGREAANGVLGV